MHEPGKWDQTPGTGPLGGNQFSEADLDRLLAGLKAPEEVCPAPGFYARVMDRIETQRTNSIWSAFLSPIFGRKLAVASCVLMLLLGAALFVPGSEVDEELWAHGSSTVVTVESDRAPSAMLPIDGPDQDKDAVLMNLVTYQEH
jgi:hypothetical protein